MSRVNAGAETSRFPERAQLSLVFGRLCRPGRGRLNPRGLSLDMSVPIDQ